MAFSNIGPQNESESDGPLERVFERSIQRTDRTVGRSSERSSESSGEQSRERWNVETITAANPELSLTRGPPVQQQSMKTIGARNS